MMRQQIQEQAQKIEQDTAQQQAKHQLHTLCTLSKPEATRANTMKTAR